MIKLHITKRDDLEDYSQKDRFCFAVIDLDISEKYPSNYVGTLPVNIGKNKNQNIYEKIFGEKSAQRAMVLLADALKVIGDSEIKREIERRIKLLAPKSINLIKCCSCGILFLPIRVRKFKNDFCEDCLKKIWKP